MSVVRLNYFFELKYPHKESFIVEKIYSSIETESEFYYKIVREDKYYYMNRALADAKYTFMTYFHNYFHEENYYMDYNKIEMISFTNEIKTT